MDYFDKEKGLSGYLWIWSVKECNTTDLSHGSWIDHLGTNNEPSTRSLGSSKRGILPLYGTLCKSSLHLLLVTLPTGGRGVLASTQMHAGIVFLFILSLPCRHVLFFFLLPTFPQLFVSRRLQSVCAWTFCFSVLFVLSAHHQHYVEKRLNKYRCHSSLWNYGFPCVSWGLRK